MAVWPFAEDLEVMMPADSNVGVVAGNNQHEAHAAADGTGRLKEARPASMLRGSPASRVTAKSCRSGDDRGVRFRFPVRAASPCLPGGRQEWHASCQRNLGRAFVKDFSLQMNGALDGFVGHGEFQVGALHGVGNGRRVSFLTGLLASSRRRLYSSRGSVTLPEAGTGGRTTSSAAAAKPGRTNIHASKIARDFFTCHLPFLVSNEADDAGWSLILRRYRDEIKGRWQVKKSLAILLAWMLVSSRLCSGGRRCCSTSRPSSGNVTLPLDEYNRLLELASKPVRKLDTPPVPYTMKRADLKLTVANESVQGTVHLQGEIFTKARPDSADNWHGILDARQEGKGLPLELENGTHTAVITGPADFAVTLDAGLPLSIEAGRASFNLPVPSAGSVRLVLVVPGDHTNVRVSPGIITSRSSANGQTAIEATLVPGQPANVGGQPARMSRLCAQGSPLSL